MASTIRYNLVATEGYIPIPLDIFIYTLSFVDVRGLGRLARVSKNLLKYTEEDRIWKPRYESKWTLPVEWIYTTPPKWKDYYLTVVKVRQIAPDNLDDETETSTFWSFGLPEESANYKAQQTTLDLQQACIMAAQGAIPVISEHPEEFDEETETTIFCHLELLQGSVNSKAQPITIDPAAKTMMTLAGNSEDHKIFIVVFQILHLMRQGNRAQAEAEFLKNRKSLNDYSRLLGWWLSEILYKDSFSKEKDLNKITFPTHQNPEKMETRNFLQGFFLIWLKHGEATTHFNTLRALRKIAHLKKESGKEEFRQGLFLEELIIWTLCRNKSTADLENLATLFLHYPHKFTSKSLVNSSSAVENSLDHPQSRADELENAQYLYRRVISSCHPQRIPLQLATNLSHALIQLKHIRDTTAPAERVLLLPPSIFQTAVNCHEKMRIKDFDLITRFTALFRIKQAFPFMGACLKWIRLPYDHKTLQLMVSFLCTKIYFYQQTGNLIEALYAWIDLCVFLDREENANVEEDFDLFQTIYSILNADKKMCEEMISIQSKLSFVKLAAAYALYRLNRIDESLYAAMKIVSCFDKHDFQWLSALGQVNFRAVVIYSLCLDKVAELEHYYLEEMLDYHPEQSFYIYHNLATRIYFLEKSEEGSDSDLEEIRKALEYAEEADTANPNQPETHILTGLCHSFNGDHDEGQHEIKMGIALCPEKFSLCQKFSQEQLLIFPVEES